MDARFAVENLEGILFDLAGFNYRHQWSTKMQSLISRANPKVCLQWNQEVILPQHLQDFKGLNLQIQCSQHNAQQPLTVYKVFGVVQSAMVLQQREVQDESLSNRLTPEANQRLKLQEARRTRFLEVMQTYRARTNEIS